MAGSQIDEECGGRRCRDAPRPAGVGSCGGDVTLPGAARGVTAADWPATAFLDAIRDPAHERHAELKEWIGCDFDPDNVDSEELVAHVAMLAKQWARTPATRRTRRT